MFSWASAELTRNCFWEFGVRAHDRVWLERLGPMRIQSPHSNLLQVASGSRLGSSVVPMREREMSAILTTWVPF